MKNSVHKRKRFRKPFGFLVDSKKKTTHVLHKVFQNCHPQDFNTGLEKWQRLALCNDQSSYDEANSREDLMDMIDWLKKLADHWYAIYRNKAYKNKLAKGKSKHRKKATEKEDTCNLFIKDEHTDPFLFLNKFCNTFDPGYLEMELLDLLDAVITYEGINESYKGNLIFFYQHLLCLVRLSFKVYNKNSNHLKQQWHAQE
ncbi:MAG: hypothetical protein BGP13_02010 [Sphingobacteriales bacterium 40-81]|nr:MAG: hypothetical protein BGP13_02010 [Sphingobacteriales bacterium 40-81]